VPVPLLAGRPVLLERGELPGPLLARLSQR